MHRSTLEQLEDRLAAYVRELETADRLTRVGLKKTSDLAAVQKRYGDLFTPGACTHAAQLAASARGDRRERSRRVRYDLEAGLVYAGVAEAVDALTTTLLQTTVTVDDQKIPYFNLQPLIAKEPDFQRRERLADAAQAVTERHNPARQDIQAVVLKTMAEQLAAPSYTEYFATKKQVAYRSLLDTLQGLRERLWPQYQQAMGARHQAVLRLPLGEARAVHASYLIKFSEIEHLFPANSLRRALSDTLAGLGLPLSNYPNIQIDDADRPNKNPRAVCYAPDPPREVHLVIKPIGGLYDYEAFFHEAGHALHYANVNAKLPVSFRVLSTSHALTEVYSYLFEHLIYDPQWLIWRGLSPSDAARVARLSRLGNLFMLLRYIGKLKYELAFYEDPTSWPRNAKLYADTLTEATDFHYQPASYLVDMDSGFYSADYLRAWLTQAQLSEYLAATYGPQWFTVPAAGQFLKELWQQGTKPENEDIARQIGATPHDPAALERFYATAPPV